MKKVLLTVALVASTGQVLAQEMSGIDLLGKARSNAAVNEAVRQKKVPDLSDILGAGTWLGFVHGVSETLDQIDPKTCIPANSNLSQWAAVVQQYLEQHPARLHMPASLIAREAIQRAFPCR